MQDGHRGVGRTPILRPHQVRLLRSPVSQIPAAQLSCYTDTHVHIHMNMPSTCIWSDFVQVDHFSTYGSSTGLHIPQEIILDH